MSDTPVAPLPPSYDWGFVVGRSISAMADTIEDPDRHPEARGSNGRVTFTPHTRYKKELSAPTAFVQFEVITARIENGNVVDAQGENGIYLISGAYKVAFTIDSGSIPGFDILVTPDHTLENPLDLVTASPFVPEVGTPVTTAIIPAGAAEDQVIAWRNGRLVWVNGSVQAEAAAARAEAAATAAEEWKPEFTWSDTNLVIDGVPGPDLKGEKGDGSSWDELTGKPETYPSTIPEVEGLQAIIDRNTVGTGWLDAKGLSPEGVLDADSASRIKRVGNKVYLEGNGRPGPALADQNMSAPGILIDLPAGFWAFGYVPARGSFSLGYGVHQGILHSYVGRHHMRIAFPNNPSGKVAGYMNWSVEFDTGDAWPTVLPGDPV